MHKGFGLLPHRQRFLKHHVKRLNSKVPNMLLKITYFMYIICPKNRFCVEKVLCLFVKQRNNL